MGMAASQARLLTITARLNHVELESQNLSNAKIRLSDSTQKASDEYIKALNKTEYLYNNYNEAGEFVSTNLTGAALTTYGELKNQYGLINSAGQILVSELDGANYMNSNTLEEFLEKYGVMGELGSGDTVQVINPEYQPAIDEYEKELGEWVKAEPILESDEYKEEVTGTNSELYKKFLEATEPCYSHINVEAEGCYKHVLAHLVDLTGTVGANNSFTPTGYPKSYPTTTGDNTVIDKSYLTYSYMAWEKKSADMIEVSEAVCDPNKIIYAAENEEMKAHLLEMWNSDDPAVTEQMKKNELLMNNYYIDEEGNAQLKTLKQKTIDLLYVSLNYNKMGIDYQSVLLPIMITFQEDMQQAFTDTIYNKEKWKKDHDEWLDNEPQKTDVPMYIDKQTRKITDLDKAQWYVNLWHRMNGSSDFKAGFGNSTEYNPSEGWASKSKTEQSWAVLKDGDMNSAEYLKFAIDNGLITLEQVQFVDPSKTEQAVKNIEWTSIIFTNAQDITEQKNQLAITKAETKYEQALREIESKDKRLDVQMKKLDTEHNALQTEYDSIKGVIEKNVERNFKIFS